MKNIIEHLYFKIICQAVDLFNNPAIEWWLVIIFLDWEVFIMWDFRPQIWKHPKWTLMNWSPYLFIIYYLPHSRSIKKWGSITCANSNWQKVAKRDSVVLLCIIQYNLLSSNQRRLCYSLFISPIYPHKIYTVKWYFKIWNNSANNNVRLIFLNSYNSMRKVLLIFPGETKVQVS